MKTTLCALLAALLGSMAAADVPSSADGVPMTADQKKQYAKELLAKLHSSDEYKQMETKRSQIKEEIEARRAEHKKPTEADVKLSELDALLKQQDKLLADASQPDGKKPKDVQGGPDGDGKGK